MCRFSDRSVYLQEDRISSLPDEVRCHILSFLPSQNSVATSALSKNWRCLWRSVPSLHLDYLQIRVTRTAMEDIVSKLLLHPDEPIDDIYLHTGRAGEDLSLVNSWLQAAISRQVRTLDICFPVTLPADTILSLCWSPTLEVLKLLGGFNLRLAPPGAPFSFPRLKVLHLVTHSTNPGAMHTLCTACPELEELVLEGRLSPSDKGNFEISVPTLKRLSLNFRGKYLHTRNKRRNMFPFDIRFNITAPALEYLFLIGPDLIFKLGVLPLLKRATIDIDSSSCYHYKTTSFVEFLNAMSNVNSLCLCPRTMCALDCVSVGSFPNFPKLTRLEVQLLDGSDWNTMINLLKGSSKLEVFVLMKEEYDFRGCGLDPSNSLTFIPVNQFAVKLVKVIEIPGFKGRHDEEELTSYLQKHVNIRHDVVCTLPPSSFLETSVKTFCFICISQVIA